MTLCIGCKRYTVLNASYLVRLPYCAIQPSTAISHVSLFSSQEASEHLPLGLENSKDAFPGVSVP